MRVFSRKATKVRVCLEAIRTLRVFISEKKKDKVDGFFGKMKNYKVLFRQNRIIY